MDGFSTATAVVGLVDSLLRLSAWLRETLTAAGTVDEELQLLKQEIDRLIPLYRSLEVLRARSTMRLQRSQTDQTQLVDKYTDMSRHVGSLWTAVDESVKRCTATVNQLQNILQSILGNLEAEETSEADDHRDKRHMDGYRLHGRTQDANRAIATISKRIAGLKTELKRQSKETAYMGMRQELQNQHIVLNTTLIALQLYDDQDATAADKQLSDDVKKLGFELQLHITSLSPSLRDQLQSAKAAASNLSLNRHFIPPRQVSSIYTGREDELHVLQRAMLDAYSQQDKMQKRFIVYGLGGSGKTEFCCKFALQNRQCFWAIFTVDASSKGNSERSFGEIAKLGGVEPKPAAAMHWLSSLAYPWLLIIDNADDSNVELQSYFPESEKGFILVTTRDPSHKIHGNIGPKFFQFGSLDSDQASQLLLKASGEEMPWTIESLEAAQEIVSTLGCLPLALIYAGRAILRRLCSLQEYIEYFSMSLRKIRREAQLTDDSTARSDHDEHVFATYEILYRQIEVNAEEDEASRDAVELLRLFSFMDCRNIRIDFLRSAVVNPRVEARQMVTAKQPCNMRHLKTRSIRSMIKDYTIYLTSEVFLKDRGEPVLPKVLRSSSTGRVGDDRDINEDTEIRIRLAMARLSAMSLIVAEDGVVDGNAVSYYMHRLIHMWVRQRPQMRTRDQALWCQVAATTLAQCILFPPLDASKEQEKLQRDLLPHVIHVQKCQKDIWASLEKKPTRSFLSWLRVKFQPDSRWAIQSAKFSIVYTRGGRLHEAEQLQREVQDWLVPRLGIEHQASQRIMMALSSTLWLQSRMNEAAAIQRQVFDACRRELGPLAPDTLRAMNSLGMTCTFQSRLKEAKDLLEPAVQGLVKVLGEEAEETLLAMDHLSVVYTRYFEFDRALALQLKVVDGLTQKYGPIGLKTLEAKQNLGSCYMEMGESKLPEAHAIMTEVWEERRKQLGREHILTLWAIDTLARIKSRMGNGEEAEAMMSTALGVAERNLGSDHLGVTAGWVHYSDVLMRLKRFEDAEDILRRATQRCRYVGSARDDGEHLDRIVALRTFTDCLAEQGKYDAALVECLEMQKALRNIGGEGWHQASLV